MRTPNLLIIILLFSMMNCKAQYHLEVQGHRGARGLLPENSLPGFEKAIEVGVNTLELDVVISKDNKVVVSHEPYMNHQICNPSGDIIITAENEKEFNLFEMDYSLIKTFDCGSKGNTRFKQQQAMQVYKPLLSEVIDMAESKSKNILYNIEIKSDASYDGIFSPQVSDYVKLVLNVIEDNGITDRVTLQSFDIRAMEEIHIQNSKINTALLVDGSENINDKLSQLSFKPNIISPYYKLLFKDTVNTLKSEGYKIIPWTVNNVEDMRELMAIKVDGIITDYPDRLINLLSRK